VIVAQGSRFGGYSMFVKDGKLTFVYNFLGMPPEQRLEGTAPASGRHVVGVEFIKEKMSAQNETIGTMKLWIDGKVAGQAAFRTQSGHYSLAGEGLCIGYDSGDAVSSGYAPGFTFSGGSIAKVVFEVHDDAHADLEREFATRMSQQ